MPHEKRLVDGDVLDADDALRFQFLDAVHQQHRIAVRKNVADGLDVQRRHVRSRYYSKRGFVPSLGARKTKRDHCVHSRSSNANRPAMIRQHRQVRRAVRRDGERYRSSPNVSGKAHCAANSCCPDRGKQGQILALGHSDTVWPLGTLKTMPFRQSRGRLWGPGVFDMKAGLVFFIFAMRILRELDVPVRRKSRPASQFRRRSRQPVIPSCLPRKPPDKAPPSWCSNPARDSTAN